MACTLKLLLGMGLLGASFAAATDLHAASRSFPVGSLVIPMDLAYQDHGLLQAYGLVFQLLRHNVSVYWVIDPAKEWHAQDCDTPGNECSWDCAEEGSGPCPYPTASPDFFASSKVLWDDAGAMAAGTAIATHGYRGGPFVVDAADRIAALEVIDAWNDESAWAANPWAKRTVFQVVSVHESTEEFTGYVRKEMVAAPTIAVFSDGNEDIATSYLRAAGIPQSNGSEFPAASCGAGECGAGTANPDMLTVPSVAGDLGTCDAPNLDHRNGQLFQENVPAYCQIMSMHWGVKDRETVECGGGACGPDQDSCGGKPITYHGHEVVAEVRAFLQFPVHFFAECQAVNAYENTTPNPAWPFLDDDGRDGHFLTTTGTPPPCGAGQTCTDSEFACTPQGCNGGTQDCCLPTDVKEQGAGFMIATQPAADEVQILRPDTPYNQLDGAFATVGGSEPAYNLSSYLGTKYKNDREVTFITGPAGPGVQDVWMTGYLDGDCYDDVPIVKDLPDGGTEPVCGGKVSYLGGHRYDTKVPVSGSPTTQGTRLFLNALFEADCVTSEGQPDLSVYLTGDTNVAVASPEGAYSIRFENGGLGTALDGELRVELPAGVSVVDAGGGVASETAVVFEVGAIGSQASALPPSSQSRTIRLRFPAMEATYTLSGELGYRVGATNLVAGPVTLGVGVGVDAPVPDGGAGAGGTGGSSGTGGGGDTGGSDSEDDSGCGCRTSSARPWGGWLLVMAGAYACIRRRRDPE